MFSRMTMTALPASVGLYSCSHLSSTHTRAHNQPISSQGDYKIKVRANSAGAHSSGHKQSWDESTFVIVSGTTNTSLTKSVSKILGSTPANVTVDLFSDGEISCVINETVRGKDIYLFQSYDRAVNDNVMELLLTVTALRRAGAASITAVIPYFPYKFHRNRGMPISTHLQTRFLWNAAGDIAKMLTVAGVDKVLSVDLQRPGQNHEACFFDSSVPVETIDSNSLFVEYFANTGRAGPSQKTPLIEPEERIVILSPNTEFVKKARRFQRKLQDTLGNTNQVDYAAFLDDDVNNITVPLTSHNVLKEDTPTSVTGQFGTGNHSPSSLSKMYVSGGVYKSVNFSDDARLMGDVSDSTVVIIDDIMESSDGLASLGRRLIREGAKKIIVCASHGVFVGNSMNLIDLSVVDEVIVTDSVPLPKHTKVSKKVHQVSVAPLIANIINSEVRSKQGQFEEETEHDFEGGEDDVVDTIEGHYKLGEEKEA